MVGLGDGHLTSKCEALSSNPSTAKAGEREREEREKEMAVKFCLEYSFLIF
jgi:hypothetical protein